ncbi:GntR family transcriptional regulator [Streptomyces sp. WMMC1477]|uniref:GntR family transcriptional regulator n=1 Tax=Streptomyces sp. WMMC1477 TaxID=3015155 RepID=UPI0022B6108F|nr:GntR family transcriptional regulator [Streptomyces sp. WMMC1477]MCZ7432265.1 GntR family transcriptional regulator [Streptomyces sp. WMMC1477]
MPPAPITRSTLREQLAEALRDEVLAGRLPAGRSFTVKEIAEQYGVSATPVREALVDLSAQGLLDTDHHRGFRVREITLADFTAMVEARTLVIEGVFRAAVADGSLTRTEAAAEAVASVRRRAEAARRAALAGDLDILIGYDLRFWRELGDLVGNPYVADFLDRLRIQTWVFTVPLLRARGELRGLLWAGHLDLVAALEAGDAVSARRILAEYNTHALELGRSLATTR